MIKKIVALLLCAAGCAKKASSPEPSHRVYLVDTFNGIGNHVVSDGVHLSSTGLANWLSGSAGSRADLRAQRMTPIPPTKTLPCRIFLAGQF